MSVMINGASLNSPLLSRDLILYKLEAIYREGAKATGEKFSLFFMEDLQAELGGLFLLPLPWFLRYLQEIPPSEMGAHSRISGDIKGEFYLRFSEEAGLKFIRMGMKSWGIRKSLFVSKVQESIISEISNIIVNTFWSALQERFPLRWTLTPPVCLLDLAKSFALAGKIYAPDRDALVAELLILQSNIRIELIFFPVEDSLNLFLSHSL